MRDQPRFQFRLLMIAAIFLAVYALVLTFAPAARAHSWNVELRWLHWLGYLVWLAAFGFAHHQSERCLSQKDPALLPVVALISGWGLLTIWRLTPTFGLRQTAWLAIGAGVLALSMRLPSDLRYLRQYKYVWLTGGLCLTALTLIFGTNPLGYGPRLWLGCCGIYLQPSEPLKLLLVVYLAAYFADWSSAFIKNKGTEKLSSGESESSTDDSVLLPRYLITQIPRLQILVPTLIMTGLAILLLLVQRDLGTASIFIFLYSVMVFLATGWWWIPISGLGTLAGAGVLGYLVFDVIRLRVDAWINPWLDPSGRSYQIVQSLLSIANGGMLGRGPGLGSPSLVPVAHSDFIFAALAEEGGLAGVFGLFALLGLLVYLGLRIAIRAADTFQRYLAAGLTAFLVAQSILIIGGNLRLLPLTGVTLPFVSYGGSSLLVSFLVVTILLHISAAPSSRVRWHHTDSRQRFEERIQTSITYLSTFLLIGLASVALTSGWWIYIRGPDLLTRTDNPRRAIADRFVKRGSLLDRHGNPIVETVGMTGEYQRITRYPDLGPIIGYNHPVYGQSGLEASLDNMLRGVEGHDPYATWWNQLLYGQSPPGLDIRLTLDLNLQQVADDLLTGHIGSLLLLNAKNGEILVMSSHPTFNPNRLDDRWDDLIQDPRSPLLNRVTQGNYSTGDLVDTVFIQASVNAQFDRTSLRLPLAATDFPIESNPLEVALAAATLSSGGVHPAPSIVQLMRNPDDGWTILTPLNTSQEVMLPDQAKGAMQDLAVPGAQIWQIAHTPEDENLTWYLGGTTSDWGGLPLTIVIVLEEVDPQSAKEIGQSLLSAALNPPR